MYEYIEHEADIGILAIGNTLEEAFEEGARAMFNIMIELNNIEPKEEVDIKCEASGVDSLFVEWLNKLLSEKDIQNMFFSNFEVTIEKTETNFKLNGKAFGEQMNTEKHAVKIEVKAATYSGLKYEEKDNKHYLQCVVDV